MSWFRQKNPLEKYPKERIARLPLELCANVKVAASELGVPFQQLNTSKFVTGYYSGYSVYLDMNVSADAELAIRFMIFASIFGDEAARSLATAAVRHYEAHDPQTRLGFGAGAADGARYFEALENGVDARGMTDSLVEFQPMMDVGEQTL